jgi:hypothetical protein
MKKNSYGLLIAGLILSFSVKAQGISILMSQYYQVIENQINAQHKADKEFCNLMSESMKNICLVETKNLEKVAKARLNTRRKNTEMMSYEAVSIRSGE